ncbi:hypothetical protein ACFPZI_03300 [Streptomyces chlorus]|uniref:Uncharacterized protein n=1 Tax=Streptomyces chlorus TaxID=887452 RepID=A0ABW1DQF4_9ACTN
MALRTTATWQFAARHGRSSGGELLSTLGDAARPPQVTDLSEA